MSTQPSCTDIPFSVAWAKMAGVPAPGWTKTFKMPSSAMSSTMLGPTWGLHAKIRIRMQPQFSQMSYMAKNEARGLLEPAPQRLSIFHVHAEKRQSSLPDDKVNNLGFRWALFKRSEAAAFFLAWVYNKHFLPCVPKFLGNLKRWFLFKKTWHVASRYQTEDSWKRFPGWTISKNEPFRWGHLLPQPKFSFSAFQRHSLMTPSLEWHGS